MIENAAAFLTIPGVLLWGLCARTIFDRTRLYRKEWV